MGSSPITAIMFKVIDLEDGKVFMFPSRKRWWEKHRLVQPKGDKWISLPPEQAAMPFCDRSLQPKINGLYVYGLVTTYEGNIIDDVSAPGKTFAQVGICGWNIVTTTILTDGVIWIAGHNRTGRIKNLQLTLDDRDFINACVRYWTDINMRK